jgi:hypothetical protein
MRHVLMIDLDDVVARFAACTLRRDEWTHVTHLRVGVWYVHRHGAIDALTYLRVGIRRLNDSHGTLNSTTGGYHETITRAFVELMSEFLDTCPASMPLEQRAAQLIASPLAKKDVLLCFYSPERLMSVSARAAWCEPDLAPLRLATARAICISS